MEKNEIKKLLYKQKPIAEFIRATQQGLVYGVDVSTMDGSRLPITFIIPLKDMGDASFDKEMEAQLLIRWIVL